MKELTRKILESGIVDKHVARLMERWGQLDDGASDLVGKKRVTRQTLEEFIEDLEQTVEDQVGKLRETSLDLYVNGDLVAFWPHLDKKVSARAHVDLMGNIIIQSKFMQPSWGFVRGDVIELLTVRIGRSVGKPTSIEDALKAYRILDVNSIYEGEKAIAFRLSVEELEG